MDITELKIKQAEGELTDAELEAVLETKRRAKAWRAEHGDPVPERSRSVKSRPRTRKEPTPLDYQGLAGQWLSYYKVAGKYEHRIPQPDRDDWRHDTMLELERAESRDGKPLPELRAYRIASIMVSLYYRKLNEPNTRVCILNGYPAKPHCKDCHNATGKPCVWLGVRPLAILEDEVLDEEGYAKRLLDTVASADVRDMPDQWYDVTSLLSSLPTRLVEIGNKRLDGKALEAKDRMYLLRYWKAHQKKLF